MAQKRERRAREARATMGNFGHSRQQGQFSLKTRDIVISIIFYYSVSTRRPLVSTTLLPTAAEDASPTFKHPYFAWRVEELSCTCTDAKCYKD